MKNNSLKTILRKAFCIILVFALLLSFSGCNPQTSETPKVMFIPKSQKLSFWEITIDGFMTAVAEYNVQGEVRSTEDEEDYMGQIKIVEDAVAEGFDAIVISAIDYEKLAESVNQAAESGVKVVVIDSDVNSDKVAVRISTDNYKAGFAMGEEMARLLGYSGEVATLEFSTDTKNGLDRINGFVDAISQYGEMQIVVRKQTFSDVEVASKRTAEILKEFPNIDGIASMNELITVGLGEGIENSKRTDITCVGFDNNAIVVDYIERGVFASTVVQNQFGMGYLGGEYAIKLATGEVTQANDIDTGVWVATKENMQDKEMQFVLFPFNFD